MDAIQARLARCKRHAELIEELRSMVGDADSSRLTNFLREHIGELVEFVTPIGAIEIAVLASGTFEAQRKLEEAHAAGVDPEKCGCPNCVRRRQGVPSGFSAKN